MEPIDKILNLIKEVISGKNKIRELQKEIKELFKEKEQKDLDLINKEKLAILKNCYDIISKNVITEVNKAKLDYYINNKKPKEYLCFNYKGNLNEEKLKEFVRKIEFYEIFNKDFKLINNIFSFFGRILIYPSRFHEDNFENKDKDFYFEINIDDYEDKPRLYILILANKKYKSIFSELNKIFYTDGKN